MEDQTLPDFEQPVQQPPKKPRPKPTRRRKVAKKKAVVKVRKQKPRVIKEPPRLAILLDVCTRIVDVLLELTPAERTEVFESLEWMCE
jgi:hypothetical protein